MLEHFVERKPLISEESVVNKTKILMKIFLIFQVQTLIVKFLSCAFAVGCGMPVGYEGPMIHLGSLVAAGMSQFKSATFECSLPCFSRFRNSEDRRNFISAGAAAGIASAFGAPVGGLLFAMEEVCILKIKKYLIFFFHVLILHWGILRVPKVGMCMYSGRDRSTWLVVK